MEKQGPEEKGESMTTFYCWLCDFSSASLTDKCPAHPDTRLIDKARKEDVRKGFQENAKADEVYDLLENPKLFERITIDEFDKKIVGEIHTRQTIFLCGCGAFVENNTLSSFNLLVNSASGAGKDWIVERTLSIFPKEQYIKRTRISEKVFTYWHNPKFEPEWTWYGKIFYNEDISSKVLNSEVVKVMCSSGSHATVLINQKPVDIEIKGKPIFIGTTAKAILDGEQTRRFAVVNCDESQDHTREILKRQAKYAISGASIDYEPRITKALGALTRVSVSVPFAEEIVEAMPSSHIIVRTVFPRFIDFIRASAALHQHQRERDKKGVVIVTVQDYGIAQIAFDKTITNSFLIPLSHEQKKLITIIRQLTTQKVGLNNEVDNGVTVADLEPKVNFWEERYLRDQLNRLADMGILLTDQRKEEGAKKSSKTYRLAEMNKLTLPKLKNSAIHAVSATDAVTAIHAINPPNDVKLNKCINCTPGAEFELPLATILEQFPKLESLGQKPTLEKLKELCLNHVENFGGPEFFDENLLRAISHLLRTGAIYEPEHNVFAIPNGHERSGLNLEGVT